MTAPTPVAFLPLPLRRVWLKTSSLDELAARQPERPRSLVQIEPGELEFEVHEDAWESAAIQSETWSRGIHLVVERPSAYVAFGLVTRGRARWMGTPVGPGDLLRVDRAWECINDGPFGYVAFAVDRTQYERNAKLLRPDEDPAAPAGNRIGRLDDGGERANLLVAQLERLNRPDCSDALRPTLAEVLMQLALQLDRTPDLRPVERLSSPSTRGAALRRVLEYLANHPGERVTLPVLCSVAGVSERTLEYAFLRQFGVTPIRYLKLRRLWMVRRRLLDPDATGVSVTNVATECGFLELGRFAGEYRAMFGELPSQTRARSMRKSRATATVPRAFERVQPTGSPNEV